MFILSYKYELIVNVCKIFSESVPSFSENHARFFEKNWDGCINVRRRAKNRV